MTIFRFNQSSYFMKGFFSKDVFRSLMQLGLKYEKGHFFIPCDVLEEVSMMFPDAEIIGDHLEEHIFIGDPDKTTIQNATLFFPLKTGQNVYLISKKYTDGLTNIKKLKFFNMNKLAVQQYNLKNEKPFYAEDYFFSTNIGFDEFKELFYSGSNTLELTQIINRICLSAG